MEGVNLKGEKDYYFIQNLSPPKVSKPFSSNFHRLFLTNFKIISM